MYEIKITENDTYKTLSNGLYLIQGESGIGKTTYIKKVVKKLNADNCSYGFQDQDATLLNDLTVEENLTFLKENYLDEDIINKLDLTHLLNCKVTTLSGGEKQRVAIAKVLLSKAQIMIFDEPSSAQDENNTQQIFDLISSYTSNYTIILISHSTNINCLYEKLDIGTNLLIVNCIINKQLTQKENKIIVNGYWKKCKGRYKLKRWLWYSMILIISILSFASLMPPLDAIAKEKSMQKAQTTLFTSIFTGTMQEDFASQMEIPYFQVPGQANGFITENQLEELMQVAGFSSASTGSAIWSAPYATATEGSCNATNYSKEEYDELMTLNIYNKDDYPYESFTTQSCFFNYSFGADVPVIAGSSKVNKDTNEIILPATLAIKEFGSLDNALNKNITFNLGKHNPKTNTEDQAMPYTFKIVGVSDSFLGITMYDQNSFYLANKEINKFEDLENGLAAFLSSGIKENEAPEYFMLKDLSGEEIYNQYGFATDILMLNVPSANYQQYLNYVNNNMQGMYVQDTYYKTALATQQLVINAGKLVAIVLIFVLILMIIFRKINKDEKIIFLNDYVAMYNMGISKEESIRIANKVKNKNFKGHLIFFLILNSVIFSLLIIAPINTYIIFNSDYAFNELVYKIITALVPVIINLCLIGAIFYFTEIFRSKKWILK